MKCARNTEILVLSFLDSIQFRKIESQEPIDIGLHHKIDLLRCYMSPTTVRPLTDGNGSGIKLPWNYYRYTNNRHVLLPCDGEAEGAVMIQLSKRRNKWTHEFISLC
jgi:hypothetical protein